jgi:DNA mismatch repair protein MutS2
VNRHALAVLELPQVLDLVASRASSALGAARVREAAPSTDRAWIEREHALVAGARAAIAGEDGWRPEPIPDVTVALSRLRAEGSVLSAEELHDLAVLLRSSRLTRDALAPARSRRAEAKAPGADGLQSTAASLTSAKPQEAAIALAISDEFEVQDAASPTLRRLRRERAAAQSDLIQLLEKVLARLDAAVRVPDMSITVRNGRYVIPVRREGRHALGGIVHDESATRGTLFVEPPAAVELGNRIRELEVDERREVDRVLAELTATLRPLRDAMLASLEALVVLDTLYARARFAEECGCVAAALAPARDGFAIRGGRHPLLVARGGAVVPFDLVMDAGERTLLLSGPNTGGKTVLLKALGLISAMTQAGIPATVGAESRIPLYDDCFADIGDEQSIEASLSTFSAHLKNLAEILASATADSLTLIDELGSGTDPAEGAALGAAVLEALTARGTRTVATTHLGALKLLATERAGVLNASLQFDEQRLEPTYRLLKGVPGRSYGLGIARRLALSAEVLARAEARLSAGERDMGALLADLERRSVELERRERDTADAHERAAARIASVTERERAAREAERTLERRAREEARAMLLAARRDVESVVRELREAGANEAAARAARRRIEELAGAQAAALDELERDAGAPDDDAGADAAGAELAPGDSVAVETLAGRVGLVISLRDDEAVVAVGAMKLRVPARTLRRTARATAPAAAPVSVPVYGELPEEHAATEVDLRGMRVDEMERALTAALDAAVRADLKALRIIHGKGTGALRERAGELLHGDPRVASFRLGAWNEGGAGVTVAELR